MKYKWMMAAACIAGLVTAGVFFFKQQKSPGNGQDLAQAKVTRGKTKPPTDTVIVNNGKKELTIALKDGSQVLLGINAAISYQPGFTGPQREIYLKGEAYFKVAKDKNKPFVVYSHGITTTALGTSFTIRALENDQFVSVALHTGKVVIRQVIGKTDPAAAIYLLPGDRLTVNTQTFKAQIEKGKSVDSSVKNAPFKKDSILHFDREPLAKVLDKLIQQYDTTIQYDGALLSELSFTGSLRTDEPLEKILRNIALLNDLTITRTSRGYSVSTGQ